MPICAGFVGAPRQESKDSISAEEGRLSCIVCTISDHFSSRIVRRLFLSERLLNVWLVKHSELKVKELPVLNTEESIGKQKIESCFKKILKGVL